MNSLNPLLPFNNSQAPLEQIKEAPSSYDIGVISNVVKKCVNTEPKHPTAISDLTGLSHSKVSSSQSKTRQKVSEAAKRRKITPETRKKLSEISKRRWENPETRQKILEAAKRGLANPESRQKISEAAKRRWQNPETRKKLSEAVKHGKAAPETREKMSEAAKRRWENPEIRQKMSEALKGGQATLEAREKMSEAAKHRKITPETRKKLSEAAKRRWQNPESREKLSEAVKRGLLTPETRQKISEAAKGRQATPEAREKISEGVKRRWENPEARQKLSKTMKLLHSNPEIIQLSKQRADEAIDSILAQTYPQIKVEPEEEIFPKGDHELQMTGSSKTMHEIDNSLPILQDLSDPAHSLFYQAEGTIDQIKISRYGDLELSSTEKKQMLQEVKEWIEINENNRELYQQRFDELFEISIPIEIGPDRGRSVYAKRDIRKFEVIGPYAGRLQRSEEELNRSMRKKRSYNVLSYLFGTRSKYRTIDAFGTGNTISLINTGQLCGTPIWNENNLAIIQAGKNLNFYVAKRDISQGEELLIDYGPDYNPMCFFKVENE